ncbi:MAG: sugar phosphate isomerase/epimerase [Planctomycetota bacterium]|nr:MAG: sugar phosphate isomerase/epimerase [Planctomycetota bacterium]
MKKNALRITRRTVLGTAAAVAAGSVLGPTSAVSAAEKPNSVFGGVQIGTITYSFRSLPSSAEDLLKYITECGISSVELMGGPAEEYAGLPKGLKGNDLLKWRLSAPMKKYEELGRLYADAGVKIHIVKFGDIGNPGMPDEQIEYYFNVAKALGAGAITRELSPEAAKRLGPMADKHNVKIGFHNHTQLRFDTYDGEILTYGKNLGINLDIGHYVAGANRCPIELIKKYGDRIVSLHIKDRKVNNGPNMPLGQGDTPLALVLLHMKENGLKFPADIELEYKIPEGSDAVTEVRKCVEFCKQVLA